jgi:hypothetical protein
MNGDNKGDGNGETGLNFGVVLQLLLIAMSNERQL